jgi:drug/metabolite transporter (DMT)-like permease
MRTEYLWIAVVGLTWGGYPLVARWAHYEGPRATMILMIAGMAPILVAMMQPSALATGWPAPIALAKLTAAGLLMGVGLLAFHALTNSPLDASITIPISDTSMLLVTTVGAILFFGEAITLQKLAGISLMLIGIVLLRPA